MLNVNHLLQTGSEIGGLLLIGLIVFAETGLLIGFFLPGDTLLIAAGVLAAEGKLPLAAILPVAAVAAILGYQSGYQIGYRAGPKFFQREDGLFRKEYLERTENFFAKHGRKTVIFARFIVVVRTVVPLVAGMGRMDKRKFLVYNILGGVAWSVIVTLAAYWVGRRVPNLDHYIVLLVVLAMVITSGTVLIEIFRSGSRRRELMRNLRTELRYLFKK
ncbi:MAG TPA: DedA family protein [Candidatus Saccharimonadales bacterium]|nr:DedA family protein [Candidatus Saccharimonadales bacterium]